MCGTRWCRTGFALGDADRVALGLALGDADHDEGALGFALGDAELGLHCRGLHWVVMLMERH